MSVTAVLDPQLLKQNSVSNTKSGQYNWIQITRLKLHRCEFNRRVYSP